MRAAQYEYASTCEAWDDAYLAPAVIRAIVAEPGVRSVLDAGCGNGHLAARLAGCSLDVSGFDTSQSGIAHARQLAPAVHFEVASVYDDLHQVFAGQLFDACVSVEVIEHLYDPGAGIRRIFDVLRPGGLLVLTTPYHGYVKNLALAVSGRFDSHFTALWEGGHIKFWSRATLTKLLQDNGFEVVKFEGAGRLPLLWKSMIVLARKRSSG
jgi:2-polyprenyl-6-hydroxyphenyl methylase/3-demethylubiquinone-9 3-methyltransferase